MTLTEFLEPRISGLTVATCTEPYGWQINEWPLYRPRIIPDNATLDEWLNALIAWLVIVIWMALTFIFAFVS